ncbi:flavin reductase family protein [Nocardiopsis dassonvillei]|uniref:flavin reductase family protein n=1 Tax=Nocardiopsis dassonvillei TaxID=2014 RepID=UPI00200DF470|nr:flavin reductase family protein [Nocardiopsis dassonvillei]MCK9872326.1 flavin reductase family protein [Nocardiopsis dassonvillei]
MSTAQSASPPHPASEAARFRETLRHHPAGVVVVTAGVDGRPVGLTATSFTSVSLAPPLVAFYVAEASTTWAALHLAGAFAVHLLAQDQTDLAARFARRCADRFAPPTSWRPGPEEVPLLDGVSASLVCRRFDIRLIGDHWLVVGEVTHTLVLDDPRPPLLYHRGAFGGFVPLHGPDPA